MTQEQIKKLEEYLESEKINVVDWYSTGKIRVMEIDGCISAKQIAKISEIIEFEEIQISIIDRRKNNEDILALCWKE